jgi:hypothetical protein
LEVLDDRDLEGGVVVDVLDEGRDRVHPGEPRGPPAPLTGDDLEAARAMGSDEDRLEDAALADRRGELVDRLLDERHPWLLGIRLDAVEGDLADAARLLGRIRREEADDGGGEVPLLRQPSRGDGPEIRSSQGRPPPLPAHGTFARLRSFQHRR